MRYSSRTLARVTRHARFLGEQNEECAKGDFVSQCASIEEHNNSSSFTARESNACRDSRQLGNGDVVAERVPYAMQRASNIFRRGHVIEDERNSSSDGGTSSFCELTTQVTTQELLSSSCHTFPCTETMREPVSVNGDGRQFGQEERLSVIKENCAISVNEYGAVAIPPQNSAGEIDETFRGINDISDSPTMKQLDVLPAEM